MNRYDGMYILDVQGKDEGLKDILDVIEKEIAVLGGKVNGTQKMDRRRFERIADKMESGFYVNVNFEINPEKLKGLRSKLKLNNLVFRQFYLKKDHEKEHSKVTA